jgi:hypothetical protein
MLPKLRRKESKITELILPKIMNTVTFSNYLVDAFVALGGLLDKSGAVTKTTLIETIKREFELTFDIEAMIEGVTGESLDYSAFCSIFEHDK